FFRNVFVILFTIAVILTFGSGPAAAQCEETSPGSGEVICTDTDADGLDASGISSVTVSGGATVEVGIWNLGSVDGSLSALLLVDKDATVTGPKDVSFPYGLVDGLGNVEVELHGQILGTGEDSAAVYLSGDGNTFTSSDTGLVQVDGEGAESPGFGVSAFALVIAGENSTVVNAGRIEGADENPTAGILSFGINSIENSGTISGGRYGI